MTSKYFSPYKVFLVLIVLTYAAVILLLSKNLNSPNLWFDESGQFWMSKGLNHFSAPFQQSGNIQDAMHQNNVYNLDPGGFTILLHYWSEFYTGHIWLRLLPFIFFILTILSFALTAYLWSKDLLLSLILGLLPAMSPMLVQYGFEVRAYSMEYLSTALTVLFITDIKTKDISYRKILIYGCIFAFLITSRYSAAIPVAVFCVIFFIHSLGKNFNIRQTITMNLCLSLPIAVSAIAIYLLALRYQNPEITPPDYIKDITLKYGYEFIKTKRFIFYNFNFFLFIALLIYSEMSKMNFSYKFRPLLFIILINNLLLIILSILGKHAWDITSRWCISLNLLSMITLAASVCLVFHILDEKLNNYRQNIRAIFIFFSCAGFIAGQTILNLGYKESDHTYDLLRSINLTRNTNVFISRNTSSSLRYLYEYGALKNLPVSKLYPKIFKMSNLNMLETLNNVDPSKYSFVLLSQNLKISYSNSINWQQIDTEGNLWKKK